QDEVEAAAEIGACHAEHETGDPSDDCARESHDQGGARAEHDAGEQVAAKLIRAHTGRPARRVRGSGAIIVSASVVWRVTCREGRATAIASSSARPIVPSGWRRQKPMMPARDGRALSAAVSTAGTKGGATSTMVRAPTL